MWDKLIPVIEETFTENFKHDIEKLGIDVVHNIQVSLLTEVLYAYVLLRGKEPLVFIIMQPVRIPWGADTLFLQYIYSFVQIRRTIWIKLLRELYKVAKEFNCHYISTKTASKAVVNFFQQIGANTDYVYVTLEV